MTERNRVEAKTRGNGTKLYFNAVSSAHLSFLSLSGATIALVLLTTWLRLWQLASIPPGLWFDESFNAMEAVWLLKTDNWPIFILGGQGREVLFHYLLALSISIFGETIYAVRLVPALLGILTIPLMYRWVRTLFEKTSSGHWIALMSTAGLAISFWYLVMNRVGYRVNTLLPLLLLTAYFFWRGWQSGKILFYCLAGLGLGLCQYTYLSGRLVPLVFVVFVGAQTVLGRPNERRRLRTLWLGVVVMASVATLVVIPMLIFFVNYPELFWERGGDVALKIDWADDGLTTLGAQLIAAIRVFIDGQDPNWRHHFLGRPVLDRFTMIGFFVGLLMVLKHFRRSANLFLLSMLVVMWLPALLAEPALHTLRLVGVLPVYYVLMALGWLGIADWTRRNLFIRLTVGQSNSLAVIFLLVISGGMTFNNYFYRWAERPEVYQAFDGPVVDLAQQLVASKETNVIIPFYLYTHASMRYILYPHFQETVFMPESAQVKLRQQEKVVVVIPTSPEDDGEPPAFVWLTRTGSGMGTAYVSAVIREPDFLTERLEHVGSIMGQQGDVIAQKYQVKTEDVAPLFLSHPPKKTSAVVWAGNLALSGYEFIPNTIEAGGRSYLFLSWEILGYTGLEEKMFLQVVDRQGNGVSQTELEPISRKMYRWREEGFVFELYPLDMSPELEAGAYFVRLGFFDPKTNERLTAYTHDKQSLGEELIVGPLYLKANDVDPTRPQHAVHASLGNEFELLGYSIDSLEAENSTAVELYWQSIRAVDMNYTVFVQVLDRQNKIIAQVDAQPLASLYPTSRWQPDDIISDRFVLPMTAHELSEAKSLVTGMYDLSSGVRLPAYNHQGNLLPDGLVELIEE